MPTRLVHLSDLHCPARDPLQCEVLIDSIMAAGPDMVIVTGDLTRRGRKREFAAAAALLARLPGKLLVVPGNHDMPLSGLLKRPFARFAAFFPAMPLYLESDEVFVAGLNTAAGSRFGDWSLGDAPRERIEPVVALLKSQAKGRLAIVACHHPLRPHILDVRRSTTARGPEAFQELAAAGMRVLLHGHLHRTSKTCIEAPAGNVCEICANTALSDRERSGAAGYNILDVTTGGDYVAHAMRWSGIRYEASSAL